MNVSKQSNQSQRGAALLMVIAVVALLGAIVFGLRLASEPSWEESTLEYIRFEARMLAESGASLAQHPDIAPGDPVLNQDFGDGRSFEVLISTEGGRIRVDNLAEDTIIEAVTRLFTLWGLDANQATIAAESLADWVDSDQDARSNGAEQTFYSGLNYPQFPVNEPFQNLEMMLLVRGMDQVARVQPLWRDYFTTYGDGLIDLNSSSPEMIEAVLGVTSDTAFSFVEFVRGEDSLPNTADDEQVTDVEEAQRLLGLSAEDWQALEAGVTLTGTVRRIESIGRAGDVEHRTIVLSTISETEVGAPIARF